MPGRVGVLPDGRLSINDVVECAKLAEANGFESVWTSDFSPRETYVPLVASALATKRIKVGTAITAFPVRNPLVTAGLVMGLDEVSGNRTILGLGTGTGWLGQVGIRLEKPRAQIREYVEVLRRIFSGKDFPYQGKYYSIKGWDWWDRSGYRPPRAHVPIYTAAIGLRMVELAGEISDGVILGSIKNVSYVRMAKRRLEDAARRSGRDTKDIDFATLLLTFVDEDSESAKKAARSKLALYASRPAYKAVMESMGYGKVHEQLAGAMSKGDWAAAVGLVSDRMVDDIALAGTAEECRNKLEEYRSAGVTLPILYTILADGKTPRDTYAPVVEGLA